MALLALKGNVGLDDLEERVRAGTLVPVIDRVYPLAEAPAAFQRLLDGDARGKLVVTMPAGD